VSLARQFLTQPVQIRAESDTEVPATEHVDQFAYRAHALDKGDLLAKVLQARGRGLTMIFTRTKRTAQKIADDLTERGFAVAAVHGDLGQGAREQALRAFRSGKVDVLVATDVAARGLDVDDVTHVINYQCPEDAMTYVHRIGRTARAGKSGTAITLIDWDELSKWKLICDNLNLPFHEPAETYSTSPHLFLELDIPTDTKRALPRAARTRAGLAAEQIEDLGGSGAKRERSGSRTRRRGRDRSGPEAGQQAEAKPGNEAPKRSRQRRRTRAGRDGSAAESPSDGSSSGSSSSGSSSSGGSSGDHGAG
jgi:superfamily II DNA/RNA helicase